MSFPKPPAVTLPPPISLPKPTYAQPTFTNTPAPSHTTKRQIPSIPNMRRPKSQPNTTNPNQTIYVRNLNEKKNPKALIRNLKTIFSQFGKISDIRAKKNLSLKGQAFIIFEDITGAKKAVEEGQGIILFDKPIDVQFANVKSFQVAEKDGSIDSIKHERDEKKKLKSVEIVKKAAESKQTKIQTQREEYLAPNSILFIQNLPQDTTSDMLASLFQQFIGFKEIRMVPGRTEIAFVEYDNELQSAVAKQALHGFRINSDKEMKISFAKK